MKHLLLMVVAGAAGVSQAETPPAGQASFASRWTFDGTLADTTGNGLDAAVEQPRFEAGASGPALRLERAAAVIPDAPWLRLAPGFRLDARLRFDSFPPAHAWSSVVIKGNYEDGEYLLRVDPATEGRHLAFFANTGAWEPRVRSRAPVTTQVWYDVSAGWDGQGLWLSVNGDLTRVPRSGVPHVTRAPLRLGAYAGAFDGALDELRVSSPSGLLSGTACWPLEGDGRDATGHGHHLTTSGKGFVPVPGGQAYYTGAGGLSTPSAPDLQLAPGLRVDATVRFNSLPSDLLQLVSKEGEYMLRLDPQAEGGRLAFFVNTGEWEPRVRSESRVETGRWYRVSAGWDGLELTLDVNGSRTRVARSGVAKPGNSPLSLGRFDGLLDNLRLENPKPVVVRLRDVATESTLLRAGRVERMAGVVRNYGGAVDGCAVTLALPAGVACMSPARLDLGPLPAGAERPVEWVVRADTPASAVAAFTLQTPGAAPSVSHKMLAFLPATDPDFSARACETPVAADSRAATYYIDSRDGDNGRDGASPQTAWRDFTPINGRTLGPGERLLIRRGSVLNQELSLGARGTPEAWAEIGTYGQGARPLLRRNGDIDDRCVLIRDPDYLRIRGLTVCRAGKGLIVHYSQGGHRGLLIEDCIAHHIEGLYRPNSHGIPEWRDRHGAPGDAMSSAGFAVSGAPAADLVLRDCEMFQCSWGFRFSGDNVTLDRLFCHDNYAFNTSPHPALTEIRRSYLVNSIFDAAGYHAHAGTMGIMLVNQIGLVIRNCHFLNQPDSGSHDQGGIDFEARGEGCLIDRCTFRNNAGAAIEMLGLKSPQARNIEIAGCRFDRNNVARKLGPSEIFIWGSKDPEVCCSTGLIRDNGYVLNPGVVFFTNQAPTLTRWSLTNNSAYASARALDKAMPLNNPPSVAAGDKLWTDRPTVRLAGAAADDGLPRKRGLKVIWEVVEGPGEVTFDNPAQASTRATFAATGDYRLRLKADDGELWRSSHTEVHVLPPGTSVARAWGFSKPLDKEGWTDWSLGTADEAFLEPNRDCIARPVRLVAGGFYTVALKDTADAHLLSPDRLDVDLAANGRVALRLQNGTRASRLRLRFTTRETPDWEAGLGRTFEVTPTDTEARPTVIDMRGAPGWTGRLKQLRLDLSDGAPVTGTCRLDYLWIGR